MAICASVGIALLKEDFEAIENEVENGTLVLIYHPNLAASGGTL